MVMSFMLVAIAASSCMSGTNNEQQSAKLKQIDSLVDVEAAQNPQRVLVIMDSLEAAQEVDGEFLDFYRAVAYNKMGQKKKAEVYAKKALQGDVLQEENAETFYRACDLLFTTMG